MDKKCIQGRRRLVSWHHTAKPFGSSTEVNVAVMQGSIERLPREASKGGMGWFKSTAKAVAVDVAIRQPVPLEESAESIVIVAPESASSCQRDTRSAKSAATQIR